MSAAAQIVKSGGVIICAAECRDGLPAHGSYGAVLASQPNPQALLDMIRAPGRSTEPGSVAGAGAGPGAAEGVGAGEDRRALARRDSGRALHPDRRRVRRRADVARAGAAPPPRCACSPRALRPSPTCPSRLMSPYCRPDRHAARHRRRVHGVLGAAHRHRARRQRRAGRASSRHRRGHRLLRYPRNRILRHDDHHLPAEAPRGRPPDSGDVERRPRVAHRGAGLDLHDACRSGLHHAGAA